METAHGSNLFNTFSAFLPYLWGMETQFPFEYHATEQGSYRTYEEWKRPIAQSLNMSLERSYRTYEEWKPFINN